MKKRDLWWDERNVGFYEFSAFMSVLRICIYQGSETSGNTLAAGGGDKIVGGKRWRREEKGWQKRGRDGDEPAGGKVWLVLAGCGAGWMTSVCSSRSM